jgi:hypothetical protein
MVRPFLRHISNHKLNTSKYASFSLLVESVRPQGKGQVKRVISYNGVNLNQTYPCVPTHRLSF